MSLAIPVLYGSVRTDRVGIRAARYVCDRLRDAGHTPTLVDPVEVDLPLLDRMHKEYAPGEAPDSMERLAGLYREADAFVIVSGEYNHLPPPALRDRCRNNEAARVTTIPRSQTATPMLGPEGGVQGGGFQWKRGYGRNSKMKPMDILYLRFEELKQEMRARLRRLRLADDWIEEFIEQSFQVKRKNSRGHRGISKKR